MWDVVNSPDHMDETIDNDEDEKTSFRFLLEIFGLILKERIMRRAARG